MALVCNLRLIVLLLLVLWMDVSLGFFGGRYSTSWQSSPRGRWGYNQYSSNDNDLDNDNEIDNDNDFDKDDYIDKDNDNEFDNNNDNDGYVYRSSWVDKLGRQMSMQEHERGRSYYYNGNDDDDDTNSNNARQRTSFSQRTSSLMSRMQQIRSRYYRNQGRVTYGRNFDNDFDNNNDDDYWDSRRGVWQEQSQQQQPAQQRRNQPMSLFRKFSSYYG